MGLCSSFTRFEQNSVPSPHKLILKLKHKQQWLICIPSRYAFNCEVGINKFVFLWASFIFLSDFRMPDLCCTPVQTLVYRISWPSALSFNSFLTFFKFFRSTCPTSTRMTTLGSHTWNQKTNASTLTALTSRRCEFVRKEQETRFTINK